MCANLSEEELNKKYEEYVNKKKLLIDDIVCTEKILATERYLDYMTKKEYQDDIRNDRFEINDIDSKLEQIAFFREKSKILIKIEETQ